MKQYMIVEIATGSIITTGTVQDSIFSSMSWRQSITGPGQRFIDNNELKAHCGTHRYIEGAIPRLMVMQSLREIIRFDRRKVDTDMGSKVIITEIPERTVVRFYGASGLGIVRQINDGIIEYNVNIAGVHLFSFNHPDYLSWNDVRVDVV